MPRPEQRCAMGDEAAGQEFGSILNITGRTTHPPTTGCRARLPVSSPSCGTGACDECPCHQHHWHTRPHITRVLAPAPIHVHTPGSVLINLGNNLMSSGQQGGGESAPVTKRRGSSDDYDVGAETDETGGSKAASLNGKGAVQRRDSNEDVELTLSPRLGDDYVDGDEWETGPDELGEFHHRDGAGNGKGQHPGSRASTHNRGTDSAAYPSDSVI